MSDKTPRSLTRRAFTGAVAGTAATAGLAACGGGSGTGDGPAEIRFSWWGADTRATYTQELIDAFNAENPDIVVKGENAEWSGYWDRLATTVAANDAPDIIQMDAVYLRSYADRGALLDLSTLDGLDTSGIDPDALATGETPEGLFGLVNGLNALAIYANLTIFETAGIPLPDDSTWTWDDYLALGQQITASGQQGVNGVGVLGLSEVDLQNWILQNGNTVFDDDGEVVLDPDLLVSWWEYALQVVGTGASGPASIAIEQASGTLDQSAIATNTAAMVPSWNSQMTAFSKASGQPLQLLRPPTQTAGGDSGLYYKPSMFWSASARTEHPEAVGKFLNYLATSEAVADVMLTERGIPADAALREHITPKLSELDTAAIAYTDAVKDVVDSTPPSPPAGGSGLPELVNRYGSEVLFGRQEPSDAASALIDELKNSVASA